MNTLPPSALKKTTRVENQRLPGREHQYYKKEVTLLRPFDDINNAADPTTNIHEIYGDPKQQDCNHPKKKESRRQHLEGMRSGKVPQAPILEPRKIVDGRLTPRSLTCVVMNLISAGYILLPHAFAQAGVILSSVVLLLVITQTYISGGFILVAGAYAEALNNLQGMGGSLPVNYSFALRNRKYEVSHLYQIFMSKFEAFFFTLTTIGDLYGITWALISIFAATLEERVPLGEDVDSYKLYLVIFLCVTIPLSFTSIIEQVWVQLFFLCLRMIMMACMFGTIFCARMGTVFGGLGLRHFGDLDGPVDDIPMADFRATIPVVMTCIFSTAYQFSVPNVAVAAKNIKRVPKVFQTATGFIYTTNIAVALLISLYFGREGTLASSNLHWIDYHGGNVDDPSWWASIISSYVTLFAAIDGVAVYPMLVIALGDILMGMVYGDDVHEAEQNWKIRCAFRLIGAIPQAIGAIFISDLSFIANYAGICTLLSYTTAPALLFLHSRRRVSAAKITTQTYYSSTLTSPFLALILVVLSFAIIAAVIVDTAWRRFDFIGISLIPDDS